MCDFNFRGNDQNKSCVFPFIYDGIKSYGCRYEDGDEGGDAWCSTKVDENGVEIPNYWGYCPADCRTHEETLTWIKDETVKMTLQYNNDKAVLWTGLEWYGKLLAGILAVTLILATLLLATGKKNPVKIYH